MNIAISENQVLRDVKMRHIPLLVKRGVKFYGHNGVWNERDVLPAAVMREMQSRIVFERYPTGERCA